MPKHNLKLINNLVIISWKKAMEMEVEKTILPIARMRLMILKHLKVKQLAKELNQLQ